MALAFSLFLAGAAVAVVAWFFVARTPENAAHDAAPVGADDPPQRGHFAPGDAGAEGQSPDG